LHQHKSVADVTPIMHHSLLQVADPVVSVAPAALPIMAIGVVGTMIKWPIATLAVGLGLFYGASTLQE
jgi:hypothetical protein